MITRTRLYFTGLLCLLGGYGGLLILYYVVPGMHESSAFHACLFRNLTGLPCPSCGVTRSVIALASGNLPASAAWNPMGILVAAVMLVLPVWLLYDVTRFRNSFHLFYIRAEAFIRQRSVAVVLTTAVLLNWIWNIYKEL